MRESTTLKKCQVHCLENKNGAIKRKITAFDMYITSGEEIKGGDWYIDDTNSVRQSITDDKGYWSVRQDYRKIIATTDPELWTKKLVKEKNHFVNKPLPKIPEDFLTAYVREQGIKEVMVEYQQLCHQTGAPCGFPCDGMDNCLKSLFLKLRSNGTIIIHPVVEKVYTETQVRALVEHVRHPFDFYTRQAMLKLANAWLNNIE